MDQVQLSFKERLRIHIKNGFRNSVRRVRARAAVARTVDPTVG